MVRKKQKNIFVRHRNANPTSTTNHEGSETTATPEPTRDDMDLSLPASPQALRPGTPQHSDAASSNCQDVVKAAMEIKALAPDIEKVNSQISNLIAQGLTDLQRPGYSGKITVSRQTEWILSSSEGFESKGATQCFQCNQFNHTAENCHLIPRCSKCGEEHQTRDCQIKRLDTPYCINCKTYGHMANYSKCPLFPKPRKGTALKTNYTNTVNSIVRPNTSYAQITKNTLHSANPQQKAPPDTNTANISQHSALEITPPAHIPTPSSNGYNECLNLITQTLQNTIQALTQLVQQINYLNVQNPTPPPTTNKKN
ncbi:uncharacterized protein TNCV_2979751 [Trichonephila clavipes]|nr:uncharacterized protein TNCV_2979751 [Trichonephila clavipes]